MRSASTRTRDTGTGAFAITTATDFRHSRAVLCAKSCARSLRIRHFLAVCAAKHPFPGGHQLGWHVFIYVFVWVLAGVAARRNAELRDARRRLARAAGRKNDGRLSGTILADRYELGEILGRGGMGEVYAATRHPDGDEVAVKVLHPFHADDHELLQRFRREADIAARVAAEFVAEIFDVGVTDEGQHFIVMERLRGEDLEGYLGRERTLPAAQVADLITKLAAALDAVHGADAVHRDLKPSNIFLVDANELSPRLLDFGVSSFRDEAANLTRTVAVLGSAGYMSPEAARGEARTIGPPADVFALGAIAYRALTGARPFPATELAMFVYEVLHDDPKPATELVEDLHEDVDLVFAVVMAKDAALRYPRAPEFARDLALAIRGELSQPARERARSLGAAAFEDTVSTS